MTTTAEQPDPGRRRPQPSSTRSQSLARTAAVRRVRLGNRNSMVHGVRATVAQQPDVDREIALQFAAHPSLDPIRDRRLVEDYAVAATAEARAWLELQADSFRGERLQALSKYHVEFARIAERGERQLHERARERAAEAAQSDGDSLAAYRPRSRVEP